MLHLPGEMILTSLWWDYVVYLPPSQGVLVLWMAYFQYFPEFWKLPVDKFDFAQSVIMLYQKNRRIFNHSSENIENLQRKTKI